MKAMVFAAGRGSRLRPLTDSIPKCLVEIAGKPMLAHVIDRLKDVGVDDITINTSYLADQVNDYLAANQNFGIKMQISHEPELLDTGGALKKAAQYLVDVPYFFVHNADIFSSISLAGLQKHHESVQPIATVATIPIDKEPRCLLFDTEGGLSGWRNRSTGEERTTRDVEHRERGFTGIHIVSREMLERITSVKEDTFSIITNYLEAAGENKVISSYEATNDSYWYDIGTPEQLEEVRHFCKE